MFEFSLVFSILKMYIDAIVFSMKVYLFFFMISYIEEFGLLFFQNIRFFFSKYLFELIFLDFWRQGLVS